MSALIGSDRVCIIDIGSDLVRPDVIDIRPDSCQAASRVKLKTGRTQAGPSSSEVALGLEREFGPRQAREQGHLEQGCLEQGLASLEAEGKPAPLLEPRRLENILKP